ncbi:G-type lectin S-receptor-like serine/threonine-protein kinase SD2-2 [Hibiscus syriacus]|uniref:non-specific serine/threonine protein kinase n=1 Tax=Hibiscus syriacus TaxID=106335 RepID=A0A6A3CBM2_HIBSY|nr:G-type lectin S-receptor-like serine/threonine-protein kinase SD2-2 [Hibiscus syriacus]
MSSLSFFFCLLLLSFDTQNAIFVIKPLPNEPSKFSLSHAETFKTVSKARKVESTDVVIRGNSTIHSVNRTFQLGFFSTNGESNWYLGIWYSSIPTQTRVWVANREKPIKNITRASLVLTETGQLAVKESPDSVVWLSSNTEKARKLHLLEDGNLVLYSSKGSKIWQSFDHPTDTWLPEMNVSAQRPLTSWKSSVDPSPGLFSLRLNPKEFNKFELVYNSTTVYWSTGNWTGKAFVNVPQMTIPYIYNFHFSDPYLPTASFRYTERPLDNGVEPPLTRFQIDANGQLKQFTWSTETENWNMYWSMPEDKCEVYGLCGNFGYCSASATLKPCICLNGFRPFDDGGWNSGDFTSGCRRESDDFCADNDGFMELGNVRFDGGNSVSFQGTRSACERSCLSTCSCLGLYHHGGTNLCKNVHGTLLNLRNMSSDGSNQDVFYVRVPRDGVAKKHASKTKVLLGSIAGSVVALGLMGVILLVLKKIIENKGKDGDDVFPGLSLKVFTYKELNGVTRGFSVKLGQGGFGAVFGGELSDSTPVAVKRLERQGSGGERISCRGVYYWQHPTC